MQPTATANAKKKTGGWKPPKGDSCAVCSRAVYYMERVAADDKVYHKTCFKCNECRKTLSTGTYAALDGKVFCKPHFKQLFKRKGRYTFAQSGSSDSAPSSVVVPANINLTGSTAASAKPTPAKRGLQHERTAPAPTPRTRAGRGSTSAAAATANGPAVSLASSTSMASASPSSASVTCTHANGARSAIPNGPSVRDRLARFTAVGNTANGGTTSSARTKTSTSIAASATRKDGKLRETEAGNAAPSESAATPNRAGGVGRVHKRFADRTEASSSAVSMFLPSSRLGMCTIPLDRGSGSSNSIGNNNRAEGDGNGNNASDSSDGAPRRASRNSRTASRKASASASASVVVVKGNATPDVVSPKRSGNVRDIRALFESSAAGSSQASKAGTSSAGAILTRMGSNTSARRVFFESASRNTSAPQLIPQQREKNGAGAQAELTQPIKEEDGEMETKKPKQGDMQPKEEKEDVAAKPAGAMRAETRRVQSTSVSRGASSTSIVNTRKAQMEQVRHATTVVKGSTADNLGCTQQARSARGESSKDASVRSAVQLFESLASTSGPSFTASSLNPRVNCGLQQAGKGTADAVTAARTGTRGARNAGSATFPTATAASSTTTTTTSSSSAATETGEMEAARPVALLGESTEQQSRDMDTRDEEGWQEEQQQYERSMTDQGPATAAVADAGGRLRQDSQTESEGSENSEAENAPLQDDQGHSDQDKSGAVAKTLADDAIERKPMTRRLSSVLNFSTFVNVNWEDTTIVA